MRTAMTDDTDEGFLSYVLGHSKTERHAFHVNDVRRLMLLAGAEKITVNDCGLFNFLGVGEHEGERLVTLARERMKNNPEMKASETT